MTLEISIEGLGMGGFVDFSAHSATGLADVVDVARIGAPVQAETEPWSTGFCGLTFIPAKEHA